MGGFFRAGRREGRQVKLAANDGGQLGMGAVLLGDARHPLQRPIMIDESQRR
jgi:hypothetical protein